MIESIKGVNSLFSANPLSGVTETSNPVSAAAAQGTATGMSFAQVMGDMASDAANSLKLSETKSFEAIQGKASTREVVDAVMNAEQSLQTAIAIRDKVVTAYLEVARMQI
ncbi:MAG TPA: flagellar hook-basal body complex protein FliE [Shinella sp.]|jgi:flagellar hook-basal body complex protein FliE|uniref:flagellar hook-basal body complex protein FliE n=1 Tax=Shinella sp. TaxID=1870904 RepID=UPI0029B51927|nr:flagellar hook-basal body complex protein FliE [Shinella sp.]MDX3975910.1 flagellar hook-basal body complex protein FliE [Shinella sp.]HEV7246048.1 flagellar hook-basal body complex protein FliE [Shinella sp.]